jgi:hypothetical protein
MKPHACVNVFGYSISGSSLFVAQNTPNINKKIKLDSDVQQISLITLKIRGRASSVGVGTRYGLDGPGIEPGGSTFSASVQKGPGAHPAYTMGTRSFQGVKRQGRGVEHSAAFSAEVTSSLGFRGLF